jgi:hypothetical protein
VAPFPEVLVSDDLSIPSPTYRIRRSRGMDPATRRLALIAGGLGGALLAVIGGWTVMGPRSTTVPVIEADSRPIRVKPENAGGMQIAGGNEDLMSGGSDTNGGKLAPPPEAPAPQALLAPPPASPPPAVAAPASIAPAAAPAAPAASKPAAPPAPVEKRAAALAPDRAAPLTKAPLVQLAAVGSEDAARSEWQRLEKHWPDLFGHRQPAFSKTEHGGRALWRVRTGGFSDVAQATAFCERVRAKGAGCSIADF